MIKKMEMANLVGLMERFMMDNGRTARCMELQLTLIHRVEQNKANGRMELG